MRIELPLSVNCVALSRWKIRSLRALAARPETMLTNEQNMNILRISAGVVAVREAKMIAMVREVLSLGSALSFIAMIVVWADILSRAG